MQSSDLTPIAYASPLIKGTDADVARFARLVSTWALIGLIVGLTAACGLLVGGVLVWSHDGGIALLMIGGSAVHGVSVVIFYLVLRLVAAYAVAGR